LPVQVKSPLQYQPILGSLEAVRLLAQAGFVCPVITVQSRIEQGTYSESTFRRWFARLQHVWALEGAPLLDLYLCPHSRSADCACHKPKPKLYLDAAFDHDIDCARSYVVGDTLDDLQAGQAIGAKTCLVKTGWGERYVEEHGHEADFVGVNLLAVAQWIIAQPSAPMLDPHTP
ncbi:MAG TPA: HAD-IIIA family hydrolase, partial [Phototrophicaceae bacterium]|nr:HAD-IIIA family hydrolase [Phototrophicaceae bacterium]